jgi:hypothetical protein
MQGEPEKPTRAFIYLPVDITRDSQFPFKENCTVQVSVDPAAGTLQIGPVTVE